MSPDSVRPDSLGTAEAAQLLGISVATLKRWVGAGLVVSVEPIRDEAGAVVGLTAASLEITDRKRAEEGRLQEAREQLRALATRLQSIREEDDGRGFDPSSVVSPPALGLIGMAERAKALAGDAWFGRGAERGTIVTASIPLARAAEENHR